MEKADVWMPLFIGDYLADTGRLTTEQHGAYFLLIMDYWRNGPPPDDECTLAQITRLSPDAWSIAQAKLKQLFSIEGGAWHHKRIDAELAAAKVNKGKAQAKAKAAAAARWGKTHDDAPSNAPSIPQAMHEECPSPSPSPIPLKEKSKAESAPASRLPPDWAPSEDDIKFCEAERPDLLAAGVADRFRDYWIAQPGVKGRKTNWVATWRNWVRNERRAQQASPPPRASPTTPSRHSNFEKIDYREGIEDGRIT
jgi:uncharacterized protein YdaU (DUF1376 family)